MIRPATIVDAGPAARLLSICDPHALFTEAYVAHLLSTTSFGA